MNSKFLVALIFTFGFSLCEQAFAKSKKKNVDAMKRLQQQKEADVVIPKESFYVKNKIGKAIWGISFARNWKNLKTKEMVPNDNEIATGEDGVACLTTKTNHEVLLLPFARVRPKVLEKDGKGYLDVHLYSGTALIYSPPNAKSQLQIGHSRMKTDEGYFYLINDRKINKHVFGVLTEEGEIGNQRILQDSTVGLTTREYVLSSEIKEQKVRKISWRLQKAAKKLIDQCRKNKINFKKMKEEAKRIYALLNVTEVDTTQQQNMNYKPVYDFPEHYRKSRISTGFAMTGSTYSLTSEDAEALDSNISLNAFTASGRIEKIFDFANTFTPIGINTQVDFALKDSSSIKNAAGTTRNYLFGFAIGPSFEINETTYFSFLFEYDQNDFLNIKTSTANSYTMSKGSVLSNVYALDKTFEFGLTQLHTHLFYKASFSTPSFSDLYTGTSSLGMRLTYGSLLGGLSYFANYELESFSSVEDTRTDVILGGGLIYSL